MSAIINGSSPSVTFSDGTTQATSAIVSGYVPYANLPAGSVLQVVQGTLFNNVSTTSATYVTTGLTASITPKFSTSKILITAVGIGYNPNSSSQGDYTLYRNSTNLSSAGSGSLMAEIYASAGSLETSVTMQILDAPATTSSTAYTVYLKANTGTAYWSLGTYPSYITLMEIAA